jgi:hypothetical protein
MRMVTAGLLREEEGGRGGEGGGCYKNALREAWDCVHFGDGFEYGGEVAGTCAGCGE